MTGILGKPINLIKRPKTKGFIKIHYVRLYKDVGGAGGFYEGIRRAYKENYDLIWLMDDDELPFSDTLEKLLHCLFVFNVKVVVGPLVLSRENPAETAFEYPITKRELYIDGWCSFFNGVLLHRNIVQDIGLPKKSCLFGVMNLNISLELKRRGIRL